MDDLDLGATVRGFAPGQKVFARYVLQRVLGRGGMGVVWLARDEELEREVALKFLPEVVANDREAVRDLKRETRRSLELTHPHIIRIYDFVQDAKSAAISMEYVAGETLAARKLDQAAGHFEVGEIRGWTEQLLEALAYAHGRAQVVHRDLKPANLMIDGRGFLKVADFGIAASVSESVSRVSAQAGSSGTPLYMSPQQMMGEKPAVTDDLYAVGATLYELLTGKPPFHAGNIIAQVQGKVPPSMTDRRRDFGAGGQPIPTEWEKGVAACLAKDPKDRPASASALARMLGLVPGAAEPVAVPPAAVATPAEAAPMAAPVAPPERKSRRTLVYAGVAAGLLIVAAVALGFWQAAQEEKARAIAEAKTVAEAQAAAEAQANDLLRRIRSLPKNATPENVSSLEAEVRALAVGESTRRRLLDEWAVAKQAVDAYRAAQARATEELRGRIRGLSLLATDSEIRQVEEAVSSAQEDQYALRFELTARKTEILRARADALRGGLVVKVSPAGANVRVGAVADERTPATIKDLRPGKYPVRVRLDGFEDWTGEVEVKANEFTDLNVSLVRSTGRVTIVGTAGAEVYSGSQRLGAVPLTLEAVPTGPVRYEVRAPRRVTRVLENTVTRGQTLSLAAELEQVQPRRNEAFENSLGMKFLPLGGNTLLSQWETRVSDYRAFVEATGHRTAPGATIYSLRQATWSNHGHTWDNVGFSRTEGHPVTCVMATDAEAFCRWLTEKERKAGNLRPDQSYRLPTPEEWMAACRSSDGSLPRYPWGNAWPPARDAANLAGDEARDGNWPQWDVITGRNDGYSRTAPVGAYRANDRGFHDLGGNVGELLRATDGSVRCHGFGWAVAQAERLTTVNFEVMSTAASVSIGFRVLLVTGSQ